MNSLNLRYRSITAWCMAGLFSFAALAWAGPEGGPEGPFGQELFSSERLASDLDLTDSQRSAVQQLMDQAREQARPYVRKMLEQHKAMRALADADSFDEAAVRARAAEGAASMTELAVIHARTGYELRKLLTPAQREKLRDLHGRHRRR